MRQQTAGRALVPLLLGTFVGTLNNNIVNVPMREILTSLRVPLASASLVVVAFSITFAVLMPLTGWCADRVGRRRVFLAALATLAVGAAGAAVAPTLPVLVGFRVVQAAATAAILPSVMAMISVLYGPERRGRALGMWAAVNGLGQAAGPPLGGVLAASLSWRAIFWPALPLTLAGIALTLRRVPPDRGEPVPLDWRGAGTLTAGAALVLTAAAAVPITGWRSPAVLVMTAAGVACLALSRWSARLTGRPFLDRAMFREPSYVRSSLAVTAQMFCLGAMLLAVPLYLTRGGASAAQAGAVTFALPAVMTLLAPVAGLLTKSLGPRRAIRIGMTALGAAQAGLAWVLAAGRADSLVLAGLLCLAGAGIAFVQGPAATGATRSAAGRSGPALGLFNLVRFAGAALGATWVSVMLSQGRSYPVVFGVCLAVTAAGLAGTWAPVSRRHPDAVTAGN